MSFQAHLDSIHARTGKRPEDFRRLAASKGFLEGGALKPGVKATHVTAWLKAEYNLGRGQATTVLALLGGLSRLPRCLDGA
ncbi:DUF4287 domain-containing protein [Falsiroseomonas sp. HC035]|uniref:DUF4287 domain-containing protein n=1 Tax=Falsiroseomonas sp. HC035 TaxID=3390999 RepID=UPI003D31AAEF